MRLNLVSDVGGRAFARAMGLAYQMGHDDAKELKKKGRQIYPRKTGKEIAAALTSRALAEHAKFLRQAYSAGMWQYKRQVGR